MSPRWAEQPQSSSFTQSAQTFTATRDAKGTLPAKAQLLLVTPQDRGPGLDSCLGQHVVKYNHLPRHRSINAQPCCTQRTRLCYTEDPELLLLFPRPPFSSCLLQEGSRQPGLIPPLLLGTAEPRPAAPRRSPGPCRGRRPPRRGPSAAPPPRSQSAPGCGCPPCGAAWCRLSARPFPPPAASRRVPAATDGSSTDGRGARRTPHPTWNRAAQGARAAAQVGPRREAVPAIAWARRLPQRGAVPALGGRGGRGACRLFERRRFGERARAGGTRRDEALLSSGAPVALLRRISALKLLGVCADWLQLRATRARATAWPIVKTGWSKLQNLLMPFSRDKRCLQRLQSWSEPRASRAAVSAAITALLPEERGHRNRTRQEGTVLSDNKLLKPKKCQLPRFAIKVTLELCCGVNHGCWKTYSKQKLCGGGAATWKHGSGLPSSTEVSKYSKKNPQKPTTIKLLNSKSLRLEDKRWGEARYANKVTNTAEAQQIRS